MSIEKYNPEGNGPEDIADVRAGGIILRRDEVIRFGAPLMDGLTLIGSVHDHAVVRCEDGALDMVPWCETHALGADGTLPFVGDRDTACRPDGNMTDLRLLVEAHIGLTIGLEDTKASKAVLRDLEKRITALCAELFVNTYK